MLLRMRTLRCLAAAMAPTETQVERQTSEIIRFLLEDDFDSHAECRSADNHGTVECDGPGEFLF